MVNEKRKNRRILNVIITYKASQLILIGGDDSEISMSTPAVVFGIQRYIFCIKAWEDVEFRVKQYCASLVPIR